MNGAAFNFSGWRAGVLCRSADAAERVGRRLALLGIAAERRWPELAEADCALDLLLVDVDQGHDEQLPWAPGSAPMATIALIGSESPGRLAWALRQRFDAHLPLAGLAGLYPALVFAAAGLERRRAEAAQAAEAARRGAMRLEVIRAVLAIRARDGVDEATALKRLRAFAMAARPFARARLLERRA
jgi:AmiR/NasT family two-component response regulator